MSAGRISTVIRRVGLPVALALVGTVSLAAGVFAASVRQDLPTTAYKFENGSRAKCEGPFENLSKSFDGWHFVAPQADSDGFVSLTLTFSTPGGTVTTGAITSKNENSPNSGAGWRAWLDKSGQNGDYMHAYVITTAGWTLTDAGATLVNEADGAEFNISHTCPGDVPTTQPTQAPTTEPTQGPTTEPTQGPTAEPTQGPTTEPTEGPTAPATSTPGPVATLPTTGSPLSTFLIAAGALLLVGAGLLLFTGRRRLVDIDDTAATA